MSRRNFLTWFVAMGIFIIVGSLTPVDVMAQVKPITLKMTVWTPAPGVNVYSRANSLLVREVEKRSGGRLKIEYYWSGTLLPAKDTASGLKTGVADLGFVHSGYEPGKLPLSTVAGLPAISHDYYPSSMAYAELHKMPELKAELDQYNIMYLGYVTNTSAGVWSRRPIRSLAEMKGKKIVCSGEQATVLRALGAVPITMVSTEVYQAMEKGTADGGLANPGYASDYKWWDVAPNYYELLFGNTAEVMVAINKDSWNKIPADLQKMFMDLREESCRQSHDIYQSNAENQLKKQVAAKTVSYVKPTAADEAALAKAAKEVVWDKWVDKMKERGLPGQKVLDTWQALYKKWDSESPFKK
jgi:TRAP-type C4-dicarboxylate transport system substrate-binding protein